jgi:hypothetical protein
MFGYTEGCFQAVRNDPTLQIVTHLAATYQTAAKVPAVPKPVVRKIEINIAPCLPGMATPVKSSQQSTELGYP